MEVEKRLPNGAAANSQKVPTATYFAFKPNCTELNEAAKERIRHQAQTAGVSFELLYTERKINR